MSVQSRVAVSLLVSYFAAFVPSLGAQEAASELPFKALEPESKPFYQLVQSTSKLLKKYDESESEGYTECTLSWIVRWTPQPAEDKYLVLKRQFVSIKASYQVVRLASVSREGVTKIVPVVVPYLSGDTFLPHFVGRIKEEAELTVLIDPTSMKIKEIRGREKALAKLPALERAHPNFRPSAEAVLRTLLGTEELEDPLRQPWLSVPKSVLKTGDSWRESVSLEGPHGGSLEGVREFRYAGHKEGKDRIGYFPRLSYRPPLVQDMRHEIKKGSHLDTSDETSTGSIVIDRSSGRVLESTLQTTLEGIIITVVDGSETKIGLVQTHMRRFTTTEQMPDLPK